MSDQMTESTEQRAAMPAADVREGAADVTANEAAVSADEVTDKSAADGEGGVEKTRLEAAEESVAKLEQSFKDAEARIAKETADHRRRMRNLRGNRDALGQALEAARVRAENERLRSELERIRRAGSGA
ncbi:hypothetical protein [Collinsella ihumii]|mgnify:CR=1 FL=1|uniref:hypothetical protein n=1 Tax=Collinsella ihumii TaxID=1720204 RepID=UPI000833E558|nr:hypothetical protein [Collinsella ihumii]